MSINLHFGCRCDRFHRDSQRNGAFCRHRLSTLFCFAAYGSSLLRSTRGLSLFSSLRTWVALPSCCHGFGEYGFTFPLCLGGVSAWSSGFWGWAVGLGLFGVVQFFAAHLFIFGPQVAILLYFVGLASWAIVYQQDKKSLVVLGHAISRGCSKPWILLALVLAFVVVIGCATPPLFGTATFTISRDPCSICYGAAQKISAHHTFSANPC